MTCTAPVWDSGFEARTCGKPVAFVDRCTECAHEERERLRRERSQLEFRSLQIQERLKQLADGSVYRRGTVRIEVDELARLQCCGVDLATAVLRHYADAATNKARELVVTIVLPVKAVLP